VKFSAGLIQLFMEPAADLTKQSNALLTKQNFIDREIGSR